jgi:hypothetical protein
MSRILVTRDTSGVGKRPDVTLIQVIRGNIGTVLSEDEDKSGLGNFGGLTERMKLTATFHPPATEDGS